MKDYISRDEAIEFVKSVVSTMSVCVNKDEWIGMDSMKKRAVMALRDVPPSDVRENVHGKWIDTGSGEECSVCKEIQYGYDTGRRFCANCGAVMDEEDKDDLPR